MGDRPRSLSDPSLFDTLMEIAIDSGVVVGVELVLVALVIVVVVVISFINWENKNLLP